jgi:hypothetical protein
VGIVAGSEESCTARPPRSSCRPPLCSSRWADPAAAQRAAQQISGARLVNNSVTAAKIRDGSLAAKDSFSARARRTLETPANRSVR